MAQPTLWFKALLGSLVRASLLTMLRSLHAEPGYPPQGAYPASEQDQKGFFNNNQQQGYPQGGCALLKTTTHVVLCLMI